MWDKKQDITLSVNKTDKEMLLYPEEDNYLPTKQLATPLFIIPPHTYRRHTLSAAAGRSERATHLLGSHNVEVVASRVEAQVGQDTIAGLDGEVGVLSGRDLAVQRGRVCLHHHLKTHKQQWCQSSRAVIHWVRQLLLGIGARR